MFVFICLGLLALILLTHTRSDSTAVDLEADIGSTDLSRSNAADWRRIQIGTDEDKLLCSKGINTFGQRVGQLLSNLWGSICKNKFILVVSIFIFCVLMAAGIAVGSVISNAQEQQKYNQALGLAIDTGKWFSNQLNLATLPLFSMAQFATELPIFRDLPHQIGPVGEEGSLPMLPPMSPDGPYTHRNVTGVCDDAALMERFNEIASTIKKNAKMEGVLVNLQLAPEAVVCLLYPLVNTEDFENGIVLNNTGARGLDLLVDPVSSFIAKAAIATDSIAIAGPLTLRQCRESSCDAAVEKAFIARLPIVVSDNDINVDGKTYKRWGFATALINWEALVTRSNIYESFTSRGMEFQLTRTDRKFNTQTNGYDVTIVVLAATSNYDSHVNSSKQVSTALQTTNNEWEITVIYDIGSSMQSTKLIGILSSIFLSFSIALLVYVILVQRQSRVDMVAKGLAQEASVETERNMTAYFAHELRNPLGAIDSALSAMPDDMPESSKELIHGMQLCTVFMSSIMNNLLDVRKMEEGKMTLNPEAMSLQRLAESVHKMLLPSAREGVAFETVINTKNRDWVLGDTHRIQQVLTNVVTNAMKYTLTGSITLVVGWEKDEVKIECIDTGPGIPKDQQELMFERFVQRGRAPGSGLGLTISKQIVHLMFGTIYFESDPTVKPGTNCIMLLPLPPCNKVTPKTASFKESQPLDEALSFLIIDDVNMNRLMLKRRIVKGIAPNAIIMEASTGEQSLQICEDNTFDVIIVDQYMDEAGGIMRGTEVVREMRRMKIESIIIGSSGNELDSEFRDAGADWVWQKPIPPNIEIIRLLRSVIAKK